MKDDNNNETDINDMLKELGKQSGSNNNLKKIDPSDIPPALLSCSEVYIAYQDVEVDGEKVKKHPVFLGKHNKSILFTLDGNNVLELNAELLCHLSKAVHTIGEMAFKHHFDDADAVTAVNKKLTIEHGAVDHDKLNEMKKKAIDELQQRMSEEVSEENTEENKATHDEMVQFAEEAKKKVESMSPEEAKEYQKEVEDKMQQMRNKRIRKIEKMLLGNLEEEDAVEYDYNYFKDIFDKQGAPALREELAKIPKDERADIIRKITEQANQQPNSNNNA